MAARHGRASCDGDRLRHGGTVSIYRRHVAHTGIVLFVLAGIMRGQQANLGYDDTPMQPNGKWHIHDGKRPQPRVVKPGEAVNATPAAAPQDATVLIGSGADLSAWQMMDGRPVTWAMRNGVLETGKDFIRTKAE